MKKTNGLKRFVAFMTAIMMVLGCISINVFAATTVATWTATNSNDILIVKSANAGRTYKAYQIFCGDESNDILSNIIWGVSVPDAASSEALITALKSDTLADGRTNTIQHYFKDLDKNSSASDVAAKLIGIGDKSDDADTFAYIVVTALKAQSTCDTKTVSTSSATSNDSSAEYEYSFGALHDGYYLVEDTTAVKNGEMASRVMVKVQGPTTITTKESDVPTIDKEILKYNEETGKNDEVKFDDVAIGDTVTFELKSKVPNMAGYNKFFFIMNDQLSKGLTFDKDNCNMKVTIDGKEITGYYVTVSDTTAAGETPFKIVFTNFIGHKDDVDKEIVVTYDATVNQDILIGATKDNFNKVNLTYSNNPNVTYVGKGQPDEDHPDGNPDNPGDEPNDEEVKNGSVGTTEDSIVYVYTTALNIVKISKSTAVRLAGAEFKITGEKLNTVIKKTYTYTPVEYDIESDRDEEVSETEGAYYKNSSGEFVKNIAAKVTEAVKYSKNAEGNYEPDVKGGYYKNITNGADNATYDIEVKEDAKYQMGAVIYHQDVTTTPVTVTEKVNLTGKTGDDGTLYIAGLAAGEYLIEEIEAPSGYNLLDHKIKVKVECDVNKTTYEPTWTFYADETGVGDSYKEEDIKSLSNGTGELEIENAAGTTLPSTGGMGTTVFYVLGSILMAGAAILLISKRRMNAWNK
jgi:fimbrial isopeptide formation D2 family protein/LPXTG-motif cell wall-anchored protein